MRPLSVAALLLPAVWLASWPRVPAADRKAQVTPTPEGMPRPAPDRLAEPTLPADPGPADRGAQGYWLHCLPCHGDRGQGLTEEFRNLYPPEHRNCWESGCHGPRPSRMASGCPRWCRP